MVLLGPQTPTPSLGGVVRELEESGAIEPEATVAVISAGWQEREGEPGIVDEALEGRTVELGLYRRAEALADEDPELVGGHRAVQNRLKTLRRAYNARLGPLTSAHAALLDMEGDAEVLADEREAAVEAIRQLDRRHLERVDELRAEYEREFEPADRDAIAKHRQELEEVLAPAGVVVIAGGHIATLLNRLRLFDVARLMGGRPIIAWSAGAMALAERVALFHDRPPWGGGHAEVFERGLGVIDGIVPLPHASARLDLDDRVRTARLAQRLAPDACLLLDPGVRVDWSDGAWTAKGGARRLDRAGRQTRFRTRLA